MLLYDKKCVLLLFTFCISGNFGFRSMYIFSDCLEDNPLDLCPQDRSCVGVNASFFIVIKFLKIDISFILIPTRSLGWAKPSLSLLVLLLRKTVRVGKPLSECRQV